MQTDRQTDKQTYRNADRQTQRNAERQRDRVQQIHDIVDGGRNDL